MAKQVVVVVADVEDELSGEELFSFLENELNAEHVKATLHGFDDVPDNGVLRALHTLSRSRLHLKGGRK
jgi:hypothetical protein